MDRVISYVGAVPRSVDVLLTNKNTMLALGSLMQAVLGTAVCVDGLACTPNTPAALNVLVGAGSIYGLQNVDGTAYGVLAADTTNQTVKQGLIVGTTTLSCPAPATTGQSVVYLVQAAYQDTDTGSAVLPYYNAAVPSSPWSGPNNTGVSQNTTRSGQCLIGVKTGTPATTGTQTTPAPDAGYTGLYAVTVANGQTSVTSGNIKLLAAAPFIAAKLPAVLTAIQQDTPNYALDTSVAANAITATLSPIPAALTDGLVVRVKVANSSTGATVLNVNGLGNVACTTTTGAAFAANTVVANGIHTFVYDANGSRFQLQGFTAASATGLIPANNLSDVANAATSRANLGAAPTASPTLTGTPTAPTAAAATATTQIATTGFVNGTALTLAGGTTAATQAATDSSTKVATTAFVQSNLLITPLGINSIVLATHSGGTVSAGGTVAGSSLTPVILIFAGASSGVSATGDSLTGTWQSLMTYGIASANNVGLWQRVS